MAGTKKNRSNWQSTMASYQSNVLPKAAASAAKMQGRLLSACLRNSIEMTEFLQRRLEADMRLVDAICDCEDSGDVFGIWQEFLVNAGKVYSEEAVKLMTDNAKLVSEASENMTSQAVEISKEITAVAAE